MVATGFAVVRRVLDPAIGALTVDGHTIKYHGYWRLPWEDLFDLYYAGSIGASERDLFESTLSRPDSFLPVTNPDLDVSRRFLSIANSQEERNELIAIHSDSLEKSRGTIHLPNSARACGYGVIDLESFSLLASGLFAKPEIFESYWKAVNSYGLFSDTATAERYADDYAKAAARRVVEELRGFG